MRYARHLSLMTMALIVTLWCAGHVAARGAEDETSDYQVRARVARVTLLSGDVQLSRAGTREWETAEVNLPLVEGDRLATGRSSRLEIQIDAYNFIRLGAGSTLTIVTLRDEGIALSLTEGTLTVRLARFDKEREYFEVDAPKTTVAAEKRGLYRIDAGRNPSGNETGDVRVTVRDDGRARIYSETSGFTLRDGRTARLFFDGADEGGDWELASAPAFDDWDSWVEEREENLAELLKYERRDRYYDSGVWGAEELDAYGEWIDAGSHGYVWRPYARVIKRYNNWTPYRFGTWRWCPPYGWVWIGEEPWGWAPYHYGRWVYYGGQWCWTPRSYYSYGHSWWHPALVVFVNVSYSNNNYYCWYPLPPKHRDPVIHTGGPGPGPGNGPIKHKVPTDKDNSVLVSKGKRAGNDDVYLTAVTSVAATDFGERTKTKTAPLLLAQTALESDAVSLNSLPVKKRPASSGAGTNPAAGVDSGNNGIGRPRRNTGDTGSTLQDRPTGAALRKPGQPLDDELRSTRLYNGREPRSRTESDGGASTLGRDADTGAVTRPVRPAGRPATTERPVTRGGGDADAPVIVRPPVRPTREDDSPVVVRPPRTTRDETVSQPENNDSQVNRPPRRPPVRTDDPPPPTVSEPRPQRPSRPERDDSVVRPQPARPQPQPERPRPEPVRPSPPQPAPPPRRTEPPPQVAPPPSNDNEGTGGGRKGGG